MASGSSSSAAGRRNKAKIRWSKLYSFSCFRADVNNINGNTGTGGDNTSGPVPEHQHLLGRPGFSRVVFCNEPHLHKVKPFKYPKNYVCTTKYNVVTFLPKALFEQFRRVANLYFLLAAMLSVTSLAPFSPVSLIAPLVFVVGVSMIKEAVEDWHRFLQDLNVNSRTVQAHNGKGIYVNKAWKDLCAVLVSLITATGFALFLKYEMNDWWYLKLGDDDPSYKPSKPYISGFLQFIRALILYGYLIPISLYVSIEVVKVLQAMLINKDIELYDEVTCRSVQARTSNLNEELGQEMLNRWSFVWGDINEVDLEVSKRMNVNLEAYQFSLHQRSDSGESLERFEFSLADMGTEMEVLGGQKENLRISHVGKEYMTKGFNFRDDRLMYKEWITCRSNIFDVTMFFRVMALCHTGIPVEDDAGTDKFKYEAESPEEVAFLIASKEFGFQFYRRTQSTMFLKEFDYTTGKDVNREYKLLNLLEFSSSRKRMSVIVRNEDGQIFLLCKGADSIVFDRLADNGRSYQEATASHLSNYAEDGFRTLAFAYRRLEVEEYEHWNKIFTQAKTTIGLEREALLETASEMIEKDLILLGAVAVEDKLQKGLPRDSQMDYFVPECIDKLAQAGIKIWLLTGDKKETAINIGFACSLLRQDMNQFHLSLANESTANIDRLKAMTEDILHQLESFNKVMREERNKGSPLALVVDGKALEIALKNDVKDQFLQLAVNCASVICCRVSPKQKALITRSVKEYTGKTILAIGDGANDVGMIQEADIE
ncbi:hypothetical protein FNV43_RR06246 [Rhamnella rubrinervis]|uniref:Phospholipid-transporting ATPase n=1 Tax=Rhamnella rubrinervis TaxID=2594499 RepID=A0A8K0HCP3_9ROSA|nr:hypothetical protein FNV43_RR06246 [Rhamnella rubrinervis]